LKAPGFNPRNYKVKTWFQAFALKWVNLYRYSLANGLQLAAALRGKRVFFNGDSIVEQLLRWGSHSTPGCQDGYMDIDYRLSSTGDFDHTPY
jgi:hypothetical protein